MNYNEYIQKTDKEKAEHNQDVVNPINGTVGMLDWYCGKCNTYLSRKPKYNSDGELMNYCYSCGVKLGKWKEYEDEI